MAEGKDFSLGVKASIIKAQNVIGQVSSENDEAFALWADKITADGSVVGIAEAKGNTIGILANEVTADNVIGQAASVDGDAYGIYGSSQITAKTGSNIVVAASEYGTSYGLYVDDQDNILNAAVDNVIYGGNFGVKVFNGKEVNLEAGNINVIVAEKSRDNVAEENEQYNAVSVGAGSGFIASGAMNILRAGDVDAEGFGSETAVSVVGGEKEANFELNGSDGNIVQGAVYTQNGNVDIRAAAGSNVIYSAAHGYEDGNKHLVSAVYAAENAEINLSAANGVNVIKSSVDFAHKDDREITIWAENSGNVNIKGAIDIEASNPAAYDEEGENGNAPGIAIFAGGRELATDELGTVNIDYSSEVQQTSRIVGDIVAGYGGEVDVKTEADGGSRLYMEGDALAANGGKLNLDFGKGGVWYGRADNYSDAGKGTIRNTNFYNYALNNEIIESGTVNININDGMWVLTGQSWVTNLNADGSIIDMAGQYISEANKDKYDISDAQALVVDKFTGEDSTFIMDLDAKDVGNSDMLYIKDNQGKFNVQLAEALDEAALYERGDLRFATIHGNVSVISAAAYAGSAFNDVTYNVGTEDYNSEDVKNDDYIGPGNSFADGDTNLVITGVADRQTGKIGQTIVDMAKVNYANAVFMDRFNKRMGETSFIDGDEGMWVRLRHNRIGKDDSFRSMNTMYEMGYDVKQVKDDGERRVGVAVDYMDGSTSYSKLGGDGDNSRKGLWLYDSWVGEKGHYRDIVARWGRLSNDFDVYAVNGENVTGDYSNNVYSISAEFGKKNDIGNKWYFEPQAQVQFTHVEGAEYYTNKNTKVSVDGIDSLIARAGFRLGRDINENTTFYFKGDVFHEFLGEQDIFALDNSTGPKGSYVNYDHSGTWYDLGIGVAAKLNKASYAYLDLETSFGNDYDETYQINAGLQWSF